MKQAIGFILVLICVGIIGHALLNLETPLIVVNQPEPPAPTQQPAPIIITATPAPAVYVEPPPVVIPNPANPADVAPPVVNSGELEAVTAALENSQRVAADCLDAWVADATAGRVPQNCNGILNQVNELTVRQYKLLTEGR
jgi:hypothetical protein